MKTIILTMLVAGFSLNFKSEAQPLPFLTNGLVSYYPLNGNANDAWGTNNGTPYNITYVPDRFGNTNAAASFAGTSGSYVSINTTNLNLNPSFTVSVWINPTTGNSQGPRVISSSGYEIGCNSPTTDYSLTNRYVALNFTTESGGGSTVQAQNTVPINVWTHAVGVWQSNRMTLYVNGSLSASVSTTVTPSYSRGTETLIGGQFASTGSGYYSGFIDDVAFYNRALSPLEVAELYQNQFIFLAGITEVPGIIVNGIIGQSYSIQYVNNISSTNWTTLVSNIVLQSNSYLYADTNAVGQTQRYYRVVAQ